MNQQQFSDKGMILFRYLLLTCLLMMFPAAAGAGDLTASEIHDLFSEAKSFFHQAESAAAADPESAKGLYAQAAMRFERLVLAGGIRNGKLYYNIGNAYFRKGDLGRAILNYRRAERFTPNDPNLKQNLEYARSRRVDRIDQTQKARIFQTLLFWHYDLSATTRSFLFAAAFALFWTGAAIRRFYRKIPAGLLAGSAVVALLLFGSLVAEHFLQIRNPAGVILADDVTGRKGDGITYQPSFKEPLHAGIEFVLMENRGGWCRIRLSDGRECWIPETAAELI